MLHTEYLNMNFQKTFRNSLKDDHVASNVNKTVFSNHSKAGISTCTEVTVGLSDGRERAQADINTAREMFCFKIELLFWYLGQKTSS